ncbi:MAG TPA: DUF748 domain-containing protein, partial [Nitrospiraceae bacterium]|nr:DUF748 domain-containing protein [Nitrospiraceae bacterium]
MAQRITLPRWLRWTAVILGVLIVTLLVVASFMDEPIRGYIERNANQQLEGYQLRIGKLDLHPLNLSVDLENVTMIQTAQPDPPLATIPMWHASLQWSQLVRGHVVSDHAIKRPVIHFTRSQAKEEARDPRKKDWQDTIQEIYPVTINELAIHDAEVTYFDHPNAKPLHLTHLHVDLANITNRASERTYPSDIRVETDVFERGHVQLDGGVNLLMKPVLGVNINARIENMPLRDLVALTGRYNVHLTDGTLGAHGRIEYSPRTKTADIQDFLVENVKADYVYRQQAQDVQKRQEVADTAKEAKEDPAITVTIARGKILHGELGFVNASARPEYRVFMADLNTDLDHFSTNLRELSGGDAAVKLTGRFMGTGRTVVMGTFRPEKPDPDFDLDVQLVKTDLKSLNKLLRAYADMDLAKGTLSFFSKLSIHKGQVEGYVKPIFKDVEVYDPQQDRDKAVTKKVYEAVVGGVKELLKN